MVFHLFSMTKKLKLLMVIQVTIYIAIQYVYCFSCHAVQFYIIIYNQTFCSLRAHTTGHAPDPFLYYSATIILCVYRSSVARLSIQAVVNNANWELSRFSFPDPL